ncbi:hypothetical protein Hanom_Chr07g00646211 [Helianthus anomalus]
MSEVILGFSPTTGIPFYPDQSELCNGLRFYKLEAVFDGDKRHPLISLEDIVLLFTEMEDDNDLEHVTRSPSFGENEFVHVELVDSAQMDVNTIDQVMFKSLLWNPR